MSCTKYIKEPPSDNVVISLTETLNGLVRYVGYKDAKRLVREAFKDIKKVNELKRKERKMINYGRKHRNH